MILYSQNNTELEYHPDIHLLEVRWLKILQEEQLNLIWDEMLREITTYQFKFLLFDASIMDSIEFLCNKQSTNSFKTKIPETSVEKIAVVTSEKIIDKPNFRKLLTWNMECSNLPCQIKLFQHHYEAIDWLLEYNVLKSLL